MDHAVQLPVKQNKRHTPSSSVTCKLITPTAYRAVMPTPPFARIGHYVYFPPPLYVLHSAVYHLT